MQFHTQQITREVKEIVQVRRSEPYRTAYDTTVRLSLILGSVPLAFTLFICIFHIPFLPIVGLFVFLWMLNRISKQVSKHVFRWLWPLHSRLLLHQNPSRRDICRKRKVSVRRKNVSVVLDRKLGLLKIGGHTLNLLKPYTLNLERAEDQGHQLMLRFFQQGVPPVRIGLRPSPDQFSSLSDLHDSIERHDGALKVHLMELTSFQRFLVEFSQAHRSTGASWPLALDRIIAWSNQPAQTFSLNARKAPSRQTVAPNTHPPEADSSPEAQEGEPVCFTTSKTLSAAVKS